MEGKASILKDFFLYINPVALRKAKTVYSFGLPGCNRVKRRKILLSKDIKIILMQYFLIFLNVKSRYMHSEKKKFSDRKRI